MSKTIKISTEHSLHHDQDTQTINLKLQGDVSCFDYLWIDDVLYTVTKTLRQVNLKKMK